MSDDLTTKRPADLATTKPKRDAGSGDRRVCATFASA
jgi:hypothetical protein